MDITASEPRFTKQALNPLMMLKALRDDPDLTTSDFALLVAIVLRTDNKTCKVRMSLEGLARDSNMSDRWVTKILNKPQVTKYFSKIEGKTRAKNLWLYPDPTLIPELSSLMDTDVSSPMDPVESDSGTLCSDSGTLCTDSGTQFTPSTLTSTNTSTNTEPDSSESVSIQDNELANDNEELELSSGPSNTTVAIAPVVDTEQGAAPVCGECGQEAINFPAVGQPKGHICSNRSCSLYLKEVWLEANKKEDDSIWIDKRTGEPIEVCPACMGKLWWDSGKEVYECLKNTCDNFLKVTEPKKRGIK